MEHIYSYIGCGRRKAAGNPCVLLPCAVICGDFPRGDEDPAIKALILIHSRKHEHIFHSLV